MSETPCKKVEAHSISHHFICEQDVETTATINTLRKILKPLKILKRITLEQKYARKYYTA
jgi:hypothetical protein